VPTEGLEKWLKAAADNAAEDGALDVDLADPRSTLDLLGGRRPDETDLHALYGQLVCHAPEPRRLDER